MTSLVDNTVENLNAKVGVRGNISSSFRFDLNGGVGIYENLMMESGRFVQNSFSPDVAYSDANIIYANALMGLQAGRFNVDADLRFRIFRSRIMVPTILALLFQSTVVASS